MPIINSISNIKKEMQEWRRYLHENPELGFEEYNTSKFIVKKLNEFGIKAFQNIGKTGVVGVLKGSKKGDGSIGLRADMDALEMPEENNFEHKSKSKDKMHACGHDGHMAMLLGAAKYLSETKNFGGTVYFIFQPAEEGLGGGKVMVEEGLFQEFPMQTVWGMHNWPGLDVGKAAIHFGPVMASADTFKITIIGKGGHAAIPHLTRDPVPVSASIISALQTLVSRNINPVNSAVVSVAMIRAGTASNVIPDEVEMLGTCRTLHQKDREKLENGIKNISKSIAQASGLDAEIDYFQGYPSTENTIKEANEACEIVEDVMGVNAIEKNIPPSMASEDFSYMLKEKPGAYIWLGAGNPGEGKMLHNSCYDFNDEILPIGASYWSRLVEIKLS